MEQVNIEETHVLPVFICERDIALPEKNYLTPFEMCNAIASCVTFERIEGCQKIGSLWRIYLKTEESRVKLLTEGISIGRQLVPIHGKNPFVTRNDDPRKPTIKITVKNVPLSFNNHEIKNMLMDMGAELCSNLKYGCIRDDQGKLTSLKNGDRFAYAFEESLAKKPLPRKATCGGFTFRIFHKNQPVNQQRICRNCWNTGHGAAQCQNPKVCAVCKKEGHKEGSRNCESYQENSENIKSTHGRDEPLSAFHSECFKVYGLEFKSIEQAYQYTRAIRSGRLDVSTKILAAPNPWDANEHSKQIESNPDWEGQKSKVMHEIVSAKLQQCQSLKEALQDSGSKILVSPKQGDIFWGTGLNLNLTCQTNPNAWPVKNMYGSVLMSLRDQVGNVDGNVNGTQGDTPDDQRRYETRSSNSAGKAKSPREKIQKFFKPNPKK